MDAMAMPFAVRRAKDLDGVVFSRSDCIQAEGGQAASVVRSRADALCRA
jgi:hypothetical protein